VTGVQLSIASTKRSRWTRRYEDSIDALFRGEVTPWVYVTLRVGLATIFLVRHSDWLRPWVFLDHHRWVNVLDFLWSSETPPYLVSPLVPGLVLGATITFWLVHTRTVLAVLLLLGVRAQLSAALLAVVSYLLFASDRYHYFHHLHFLYVSIAWLAFCPVGDRWSLDRAVVRGWTKLRQRAVGAMTLPATSPLWPLQLIRAFVVSIYLAAGSSKLAGAWLRGETLELLRRFHVVQGPTWAKMEAMLGFGGVAKLTCLIELTLPVFLVFRPTRRWAVVGAMIFHALISASMMVSTFGAQMAVLLTAFFAHDLGKK
jgi:HTTM domain